MTTIKGSIQRWEHVDIEASRKELERVYAQIEREGRMLTDDDLKTMGFGPAFYNDGREGESESGDEGEGESGDEGNEGDEGDEGEGGC